MRKVSASTSPRPYGRGFLFPAAILVAALAGGAPARAGNVTVTLKIGYGAYEAALRSCTLSVPENANGITVLNRAKAALCIVDYKTDTYSFGQFVQCIDGVCGNPWRAALDEDPCLSSSTCLFGPMYWNMRENGTSTDYGVSEFRAAQGDELAFVYTTWLV